MVGDYFEYLKNKSSGKLHILAKKAIEKTKTIL